MKAIAWTRALVLVVCAALAAIESHWVGYAASSVRRLAGAAQAAPRPSPPDAVIAKAFRPGTDRLTILATGDIADCPRHAGFADRLPMTASLLGLPSAFGVGNVAASRTAALAGKWPDAPVLALGDLVYSSGSPVEFSDCFDPVWGGLRDRTLPAPGNHEYGAPGAYGYFDYWRDRAGPDRRGFYAVRAGNWLVLSLNSEVDARPGSQQGRWLRETLARAPEACVLAFYHRPAFSLLPRGGRDNAEQLFRQLQQNGATLVLNGHNHFYERTVPLGPGGEADASGGTIAFTVGNGGRTSDENPPLATTARAIFGSNGLLRLELDAGGVRWWYHDATDGTIGDQGEAPCNPSRRPSP